MTWSSGLKANEGWAAAQGSRAVVVLATELTPELIRAGLARDVNRLIQDRRKELDLERTDRIELYLCTESPELTAAIEENLGYLKAETLASEISLSEPAGEIESASREIGEFSIKICIRVAG